MDQSNETFFGVNGDCEILKESRAANPFLSIIIPVYNIPDRYLNDCFESLIGQAEQSLEVVFVDDASADATLDRLLSFADETEKAAVLRMKTNSRQGAARNRGLAYAHGEYIGYMDPDDVVTPGFFGLLAAKAREAKPDMVAGSYVRTDESLERIGDIERPFSNLNGAPGSDEWHKSIMHTEFGLWSCLYRKDVLNHPECLFPEGMLFEDNPAKMVWKSKIRTLECVSGEEYLWRQHSSSTIHSIARDERVLHDRLLTSDMLIDDATRLGYYERYKDEIQFTFARLYLYNTLDAIAHDPAAGSGDRIAAIAGHARARLGGFLSANRYIRELSLRSKIGWGLALYCPKLFVAMARRM